MYIEPEEYFTESARRILEEEETIKTKKYPKNSSQKKRKKMTIHIDDKWISSIALGLPENSPQKKMKTPKTNSLGI